MSARELERSRTQASTTTRPTNCQGHCGRPFPVAKFLDQKEREDPTFGMLVQVVKKRKLKEEGRPAVYVEQNQRPQILYTEDDRELMEEAWTMTAAHREDLVSRSDAPVALPAPAVPRILAMLQGSL